MAERRMFAKTIIDSDAFLEMPVAAQCLYFHLAMRADDDGFMNGPKKVMRILGSKDADIQILIDKKFIIPFQSGIIVIKHWRIHNYIRQDTYKATPYNSEKSTLYYDENMGYTQNQTERKVDEPTPKRQLAVNGSATKRKRTVNGTSTKCQPTVNEPSTERQPTVNEPSTERQQNVDEPLTQDRIGKDSLGKYSIEKEKRKRKATAFHPPTLEEVIAYCKERGNNVDPRKFYDYYTEMHWISADGKPVQNWKGKIITWEGRNNNVGHISQTQTKSNVLDAIANFEIPEPQTNDNKREFPD